LPRKAPSQVLEHRMTMGTYERNLLTEIKTDIDKGIKIAAVGAVAVPVTLGVGLVGGMGLLGYGLYQGLSSFGFGNISKEIGDELSDIKHSAWCWWTNKNRKFWGLKPVDCTKKDPDIPPSRRDEERTKQEQLEYEEYRAERKERTRQREEAKKKEMGEELYQEMIDNFDPSEHSNEGNPTEEEIAIREARRAEAAERRAQEEAEEQAAHDALTAERRADYERRKREEEEQKRREQEGDTDPSTPNPDYEDDSDDSGESQYGGGSTASGNEPEDNSSDRGEGDGTAPSRRDRDRGNGRGSGRS
jgi:hypothetical protein